MGQNKKRKSENTEENTNTVLKPPLLREKYPLRGTILFLKRNADTH
jgi:hypothetical protein